MGNSVVALFNRMTDGTFRWPVLFPILIALHSPSRLLSPELWAEDGVLWYAQAHEIGPESLLIPAAGYLQTFPRLIALAVEPLPLAWTPLLFVLVALLVQSAPAILLVSDRLDAIWPGRTSRIAFAVLFCVMPNAPETNLSLTNSQWYLALVTFLFLLSNPAKTFGSRIAEGIVLLVAGVSGPFGLLLLPVATWQAWGIPGYGRVAVVRLLMLGASAAVQAGVILLTQQHRSAAPLGASLDVLARIIGMIGLGAELGYKGTVELAEAGMLRNGPCLPLAGAVAAFALAYAVLYGRRALRQFTFFAVLVFSAGLVRPMVSLTEPQWPQLLTPPGGNRYFLLPMLAWWATLFVMTTSTTRVLRIASWTLLLTTVLWAVPRDWGDPFGRNSSGFIERARIYDQSPAGTTMTFDIQPPGWQVTLTK